MIELREDRISNFGEFFDDRFDVFLVLCFCKFLRCGLGCFRNGVLVCFFEFLAVLAHEFIHCEDELLCVVLCIYDRSALLILFCVLLCVLDSRVDIRFGEVGRCGDCDGLRFARCLIARFDGHDAVCVDIESDFDLRDSARCGCDADEFESAERLVVASKLSFTLQNVNVDCGLVVCRRAEHLRFACRNRGVSVNEFGAYAAERFDAE